MVYCIVLAHHSPYNTLSLIDQIGKLIPVKIPSSTKINQAAMAQTSIREIDHTAKVAREFRRLALWLAEALDLSTDEQNQNVGLDMEADDE